MSSEDETINHTTSITREVLIIDENTVHEHEYSISDTQNPHNKNDIHNPDNENETNIQALPLTI